jgi:hypothetical protein
MIGKIGDWIIDEMLGYAKTQGPAIIRALKRSGKALPSHIEEEFQRSLTAAFVEQNYQADGYAEWPDHGSAKRFEFLMPKTIVTRIQNEARWAAAAKKSSVGIAQIAAFGSDPAYEQALNAVIGKVLESAINNTVGEFHLSDQNRATEYGWRFLSKVKTVAAAKQGTTEFKSTRLFYWVYGRRDPTEEQYKSARSLMRKGFLIKSDVDPSSGPFLK